MTALLWCLLGAGGTGLVLYAGFRLVLRDERAKRQALFDRNIRQGVTIAILTNELHRAEHEGYIRRDAIIRPMGAALPTPKYAGRVPAELFDADRTR